MELWGALAEENDGNLKPGELVFVEAQVAGRQRQDKDTKLVHHWMILKARKIQSCPETLIWRNSRNGR